MKKDASVRQFSFSDGTLKQYADQAILFATRDSTEFAARGYNAARLAAIQQQSDDLERSKIQRLYHIRFACRHARNSTCRYAISFDTHKKAVASHERSRFFLFHRYLCSSLFL